MSFINWSSYSQEEILFFLFITSSMVIFLFILSILLLMHNRKLGKNIYNLVRKLLILSDSKTDSVETTQRVSILEQENKNLKLQAEQFSCLLDKITLPIWERDINLSITYCNKIYKEFSGEAAGNIITQKNIELYSKAHALAKQAAVTGSTQKARKHIVIAGERRLFQITETPKEEGGTIGFARDITDLEEKELDLKQHVSSQADLLENSRSAIAIFEPNTKIRFYNNAFINMWGLDERFLASHPKYGDILETLRENRKLPEQADFKLFKKNQIEMFTNLLEKHEESLFLPDGKVLRRLVIPQKNGGLLFSYEDVTDRIAIERSYNTLQSVNKSTIDNLSEGVVVFGEDGKLKLCNPIYLKMWELDNNIVKSSPHISEILDKTKHIYCLNNIQTSENEAWNRLRSRIISYTNIRKTYKEQLSLIENRIVEWSCIPLPDGAALMTYTDITDTAKVEQSLRAEKNALEEADKLKTNFLASVSYELRSPLTSIKGFAEILQNNYFGELNEKQGEYINGIDEASYHLSQLIDNILDISSIDAGYMTLEIEEFNLYNLLSSIISNKKEYLDKSVLLELNCDKNIGNISGDKKRIKQVIKNLITNSIDHIEQAGEINIFAKSEGNEILISVIDNGRNIATNEHNSIFDKIYNNSNKNQSTALGMTIAKTIIELHSGTIQLESEINNGTKVTIRLRKQL